MVVGRQAFPFGFRPIFRGELLNFGGVRGISPSNPNTMKETIPRSHVHFAKNKLKKLHPWSSTIYIDHRYMFCVRNSSNLIIKLQVQVGRGIRYSHPYCRNRRPRKIPSPLRRVSSKPWCKTRCFWWKDWPEAVSRASNCGWKMNVW